MTEIQMVDMLKAEKLGKKYPKIKKVTEKYAFKLGLNRHKEARLLINACNLNRLTL